MSAVCLAILPCGADKPLQGEEGQTSGRRRTETLATAQGPQLQGWKTGGGGTGPPGHINFTSWEGPWETQYVENGPIDRFCLFVCLLGF